MCLIKITWSTATVYIMEWEQRLFSKTLISENLYFWTLTKLKRLNLKTLMFLKDSMRKHLHFLRAVLHEQLNFRSCFETGIMLKTFFDIGFGVQRTEIYHILIFLNA